ncbi:hypothetical protein BJ684DRAFT_18424 [Piptocephalis cylindrospora]|uniref:Cullin family profile domain-containing protein n=1 Tax=Piptocephalis cylindrospora TaxID=1907219 RepID=A0A4P9Y8U1_9FUNG|nr:hypothetical protein BJ684DRAFT_18424 [Piptocephalis cylindrospora]|eukprot:RKP15234.1 hypothetical protein BJ684DRAFT_18424 [Piptocephalis cylindrospora]
MSLRPRHVQFAPTITELESGLLALYPRTWPQALSKDLSSSELQVNYISRSTKKENSEEKGQPKPVSAMRLYQLVYALCTAQPTPFASRTFHHLAEFLNSVAQGALKEITLKQDLVQAYADAWARYHRSTMYLSIICAYMDLIIVPPEEMEEMEDGEEGRMMEQHLGELADEGYDFEKHMTVQGMRALEEEEGPWSGRHPRQPVASLAYDIWVEVVVEPLTHPNKVDAQLTDRLLQILRAARGQTMEKGGDSTGVSQVGLVVKSFVALRSYRNDRYGLYQRIFERPYLEDLRIYYSAEAASLMTSYSIKVFMRQAHVRITQEIDQSSGACDLSTLPLVTRVLEKVWVGAYKDALIDTFQDLLTNEEFYDVPLIYGLLSRIPDTTHILMNRLEEHIVQKAKTLLAQIGPKEDIEYVDTLLDLHHEYTIYIDEFLYMDLGFVAALDRAFSTLLNAPAKAKGPGIRDGRGAPEVLARYCDALLRRSPRGRQLRSAPSSSSLRAGGLRQGGGTGLEEQLRSVVALFKYLEDKDIFQRVYGRLLARRLIHIGSGRSRGGVETSAKPRIEGKGKGVRREIGEGEAGEEGEDNEEREEGELAMISHLKVACGAEFTSKFQRMITDVMVSRELVGDFRYWCDSWDIHLNYQFDMTILTTGAWPLSQPSSTTFQFPSELGRGISHFERFYHERYSGRRLSWLWHFSRADVRLYYLKKRYDVHLSLHQLSILLQFADVDELAMMSLVVRTRLEEDELIRAVHALCEAKLLVHLPDKGPLGMMSLVQLNLSFQSKRSRIRVPPSTSMGGGQDGFGITGKETGGLKKAEDQLVQEDRRLHLQATIVRIMKTRRRLPATSLFIEVIEQTQAWFKPNPLDVKRASEQLMERSFLERDPCDKEVYLQTPAPSQTQDPIEPVDPTISTDPTPTEVVGPTLTAYPSQPASGSNTTSAFGNVHYKYSNQPSGTINLSPCTIGKGIVFKLALDGSIATVQNDKVRIGKKKGVAEAQWLVSSGKGVLEGTVAFQNNATKQYLRRVPIQTGGDPSPLLVTQYTVDAQGLSVDTNSIWTCERMRFIGDIDKSSTSYFTWLIGGGKGQFLGRPAHNATTLEPVYSLVQASPEIDDGNMVDGRIVFGDLIEVFDHNA